MDNQSSKVSETEKLKKRKLYKQGTNYFREYCDNTTIHGIKYIGEKDRSWIERIWWIALLLVCLFYCYDLTLKTYDRWMQSPIIVGFKQNPIPVWEIPFPAVTICPQTKSKQSVCNYTALYNDWYNDVDLNDEELNKLYMLSLVCTKYTPAPNGFFTLNTSSLNFLDKVSPSLKDMKAECTWRKNNSIPCSELFTPVFTVEGICFTFNALDHKDLYREDIVTYKNYGVNNKKIKGWHHEYGYTNPKLGINTYPYRDLFLSRKSIEFSGLMVDIGIHESDFDYLCTGADQGFKVFLHHPSEVFGHGQQYFFAPFKQVSEIIILPEMMVTSDELKTYSPNVRQCYYPHEKPLAYYKIYTKRNCEMECLGNLTADGFSCVPTYLPRTKHMRICGPAFTGPIEAYKDVNAAMKEAFNFNYNLSHMGILIQQDFGHAMRTAILEQFMEENWNKTNATVPEFEDDYFDLEQISEEQLAKLQCDCRPSCTSIRYNGKKALKDFNWQQHLVATQKNISEYEGMLFARIIVSYSDNKILTSERKELFGFADFIGNCGGLLGLFTGFSFLSGFEILHYLTLRLWCNIKRSYSSSKKSH